MAEVTKELSDLLKLVGESTDVNNPSSAVWSLPQRRSTIVVKHKALEKIAVLKGMTFKTPQGMHGHYYSEAEADAFDEDEIKWGNKNDEPKDDKSFDKQINKLKDKKESSKNETSITSRNPAHPASDQKEKEKSSSELSDNDNVLHKVFTTFLDDCDEIPKLYEFWKSNQVQLDKIKNDDEEQYEKIKSSFTDKKIKLQRKA